MTALFCLKSMFRSPFTAYLTHHNAYNAVMGAATETLRFGSVGLQGKVAVMSCALHVCTSQQLKLKIAYCQKCCTARQSAGLSQVYMAFCNMIDCFGNICRCMHCRVQYGAQLADHVQHCRCISCLCPHNSGYVNCFSSHVPQLSKTVFPGTGQAAEMVGGLRR